MKTHHTEKFVLLGYTGYIGEIFAAELANRGVEYTTLSRSQVDYTNFRTLRLFLTEEQPTFLINCAGYTGKPNVDASEKDRAGTTLGNVVLAETIANACEVTGVPWGQVSSGCIYAGAKLHIAGQPERIEKDLMAPAVKKLWQTDPGILQGFSEADTPNFSFRNPPCSFYSGTKALGEEMLNGRENLFQWRLRIPFDHLNNPRNYLTKIQTYARVYDNVNSLSHRGDFARACLDLWELRAPFGTYNITNPGWVTTRIVAEMLQKKLNIDRAFVYFQDDDDFYQAAAAPRSNTILDTTKLLSAGINMRSAEEALVDAIMNWRSSETDSINNPPVRVTVKTDS